MTSFRSEAEEASNRTRSATFEWRGVTLEVQFDPDWLGMGDREDDLGYGMAHLEVKSVSPERAPLPITETGYLSHFLGRGVVEEAESVEAFAKAWLDEAAQDKVWRRAEEKRRELDLFG